MYNLQICKQGSAINWQEH
uniref:Uncharacterized protein n=1 Tax=Anguilla anguilla TaxID=7936 RepID=A0A0E9TEM4_ANGAN